MAKFILIVEDDCDAALAVAEVLQAEGYETLVAANGREALRGLETHRRPDLILLDMMMPVMDGWQFREEQTKMAIAVSVPVVAMTADGDARGKATAIRAAGHISKPVTVDRLLDEVERVCGLANG